MDPYSERTKPYVSTSSLCLRRKQSLIIITGARRSQAQYGAVDLLLLRSQAQARKRVVYFLTVFTITGLGSMCLLSIDIGHAWLHAHIHYRLSAWVHVCNFWVNKNPPWRLDHTNYCWERPPWCFSYGVLYDSGWCTYTLALTTHTLSHSHSHSPSLSHTCTQHSPSQCLHKVFSMP